MKCIDRRFYFICFLLAAFLLYVVSRIPQQHEVIYKVHGKAGSEFLRIRYVDTPAYGFAHGKQIKRVRIPATSLPWTMKVRLPDNAMTFIAVNNEDGKKSALQVSTTIDKRVQRKWADEGMEEIFDNVIIRPLPK